MEGGRQSKVKRAARWSREIESELAKLYKKFPCLWMTDSPTYKDLEGRYAAYVRIVEALRPRFGNLSVPMVVYKIRDLRYRYCAELTKIERAAVSGVNYTPNVPWFPVMRSFLNLRFRTEEIKDPPQSSDELFSSGSGDEVQMNIPENYHDYDGTRLTPSTCQTIYDNRLKIGDSKNTVGESEESGNDREREGAAVAAVENCVGVCIGDQASGEIPEIKYHLTNEFTRRGSPLEISSHESAGLGKKSSETRSVIPAAADAHRDQKIELRNEVTVRPAGTERVRGFDEFKAFGMSIGSQLKGLEPSLVSKLEVKILMILNEERTRSAQL